MLGKSSGKPGRKLPRTLREYKKIERMIGDFGKVLRKEEENVKTSDLFYRTLVQVILLYG